VPQCSTNDRTIRPADEEAGSAANNLTPISH